LLVNLRKDNDYYFVAYQKMIITRYTTKYFKEI